MLNHAIIGCGRVAENHADAFSILRDVHIRYAVDLVEDKARAIAEKYSIPATATDLYSILNDPSLHSISLAVPHHLHGPLAIDAAKAGKHVLIEKPLVLDRKQGEILMDIAADTGVVVLPVSQHRFDKIVCEVKALVESGEMGEIRYVRGHIECNRPSDYYRDSDWRGSKEKEGGSVLINQAYHLIDLMLYLAGPVSGVSAVSNTFQKEIMETEDTLCAILSFENGALGTLGVCGSAGSSWASYIELICENGLVAFDINFPNQLHRFEMTSKRDMKKWRDRLRDALPQMQDVTPGISYYGISHRYQAADFISVIRKERPTAGATLQQALYTIDVINSIYDAADRAIKKP